MIGWPRCIPFALRFDFTGRCDRSHASPGRVTQMLITVDHHSSYCYDPLSICCRIFRLRPRMTTTQRLIRFNLEVQPAPTGTTECLDRDGKRRAARVVRCPVRGTERNQPVPCGTSCVPTPSISICPPNRTRFPCGTRTRYRDPFLTYSNAHNVDESVKRFANRIARTR